MNATLEARVAMQTFIDQPVAGMLVTLASDVEVVARWTLLNEMGRSHRDGILLFPFSAPSPRELVDAIVQAIVQSLAARSAQEQRVWALPASCQDPTLMPAQRLRLALDACIAMLPDEETRLVWAILPATIGDTAGYRALIESFLEGSARPAWMRRARLLVRDLREGPRLTESLVAARAPYVLFDAVDLGPNAIAAAWRSQAMDPDVAVPERVRALFLTASMAIGQERLHEAREGFEIVYEWATTHDDSILRVLSLRGIGMVLQREGALDAALMRLQQGLALSMQLGEKSLVASLLPLAAETCAAMKRWDDADAYYEAAEELALRDNNPMMLLSTLERRALLATYRNDVASAIKRWEAARWLGRELGIPTSRRRVLEQLSAFYARNAQPTQAEACRTELDSIGHETPHHEAHP